jgi:hypothetical protein
LGIGTSSKSSARLILRVILTLSAVLQIYSYAFVVTYSLLFGAIDFVLPVKVAFGSTLSFALIVVFIDFNTAYNNRHADLSELGLSIYRLVFEIISVVSLLVVGYFFLLKSITAVDLTSLGWEVKASVTISIALSLVFTLLVLRDLRDLWRRGRVPTVLSQPQDKKEEPKK